MTKEESKGIALAILGIIAVLAVVGLVMLFSSGATGKFVAPQSGIVQYEPNEACERIGGTLVGLEGGIDYKYRGPFIAVCNVNGRTVRTPVITPT